MHLSPLSIYEQQVSSQVLSDMEQSVFQQQGESSDLVSKYSLRFILGAFVPDEESSSEEELTSEPPTTVRRMAGRPGNRT